MTALVTKHMPLVAGAPDGIKRLKALILELAVGGKLVPQDARDEPASELIKRIDAARERLVGELGVRKRKVEVSRTPSNKLKHLPVGWASVTLGQITTIRGGSTPSMAKAEYWGGDIPWVSPKDMHSGDIVGSELMITDRALQETNIELVPVGSILLVGRSGILKRKLPAQVTLVACTVNQDIKALTPVTPMESRYVQLLLQGTERQILTEDVKTGTTVQSLVFDKLFSREFGLPPLAEQHRIVAKVDELMTLCDRLEADQADAEAAHAQLVQALLDSLTQANDAADFRASWQRLSEHFHTLFTTEASIDALKAAVLELGVTGRLVKGAQAERTTSVVDLVSLERRATLSAAKSIKHEELANAVYWDCPYDLPKDWSWVSLAALVMQITDGTHHTPTYVERGVPFISVKDLDGKTVSFEDCRQIPEAEHEAINTRCNPERGDLLLCRIGTLGRPTIVDTDRPFSLFVSVGLLKMPKRIDLSNFLHLVLSSPLGYRQYERIKAGGSHTNKLNLGDIPKIMIPVPPLEDQRSIIAKVDELMALCDQLKIQLAKACQQHAQLASVLVEQAVGAS